jgi:hypothetical protein
VTTDEVKSELLYLQDHQLAETTEKLISPENARWRIRAKAAITSPPRPRLNSPDVSPRRAQRAQRARKHFGRYPSGSLRKQSQPRCIEADMQHGVSRTRQKRGFWIIRHFPSPFVLFVPFVV